MKSNVWSICEKLQRKDTDFCMRVAIHWDEKSMNNYKDIWKIWNKGMVQNLCYKVQSECETDDGDVVAWDLIHSRSSHVMWSWSNQRQALQQQFERIQEDWRRWQNSCHKQHLRHQKRAKHMHDKVLEVALLVEILKSTTRNSCYGRMLVELTHYICKP